MFTPWRLTMKPVAAGAVLALITLAFAQGEETKVMKAEPLTAETIRSAAPALEKYKEGTLLGGLWKRPDLSRRDRSIITLAALIARNQTIEQPYYLALALDNGVKPSEISEIITHLAFYSGWANAMSAIPIAHDVFAKRGIKPDQLAP